MTIVKKRILVVDDEPNDTQLLKLCLERTDRYVVREENDATAALAAAEEFEPDLILLDILMPGRDGVELAACFAASDQLKAVPIIFLTCRVSKGEVLLCGGRIGKYPFLAKPIVLTEVVHCVEKQLAVAEGRAAFKK